LFIVSELSGEELTTRLNELIQEWSQDRFKKPCIIEFDYEGYFDRVLIVALCHYKGYIVNTRGEMKCETKGIAAKRSNSSVFVKDYQTILIEKILNKESEADVSEWVQGEMERIKTLPLADIATPCKLARLPEEYTKKYEKFVRALNNTKSLIKYHKRIGERYYHINIMPEVDDKGDWKLGIMDRKFDVLAFDKKCYDHVDREKIDWYEVINTNIIKKTEHIYEVMDWDFVRIKPERGRRTKRLMLERKKLPENKQ